MVLALSGMRSRMCNKVILHCEMFFFKTQGNKGVQDFKYDILLFYFHQIPPKEYPRCCNHSPFVALLVALLQWKCGFLIRPMSLEQSGPANTSSVCKCISRTICHVSLTWQVQNLIILYVTYLIIKDTNRWWKITPITAPYCD